MKVPLLTHFLGDTDGSACAEQQGSYHRLQLVKLHGCPVGVLLLVGCHADIAQLRFVHIVTNCRTKHNH